ncbi:TlpA family protein disulfide reductase [Elizabethkingia ursingii]|uniref:Thioredoxin domain-containing protein n=1 Tax=Elizabethkingia ursingii TaxID=1756150 RepID=A0ABX3NDG9_9FLAO|nr:TlpA disulfide reductase family protein [Elizabethkingia ursingii]OPB94549.1 hypothetical protein BB021_18280 [Elizabethkingia ursingii]
MKNIFCRGLLSLVLLILFSGVNAQKKQLKIGDKLPDVVWSTALEMVNHPQKTLTLSAYKDRLILLDFWATWCGGCLQNFPKMEALEKKFGDKIKILAVSNESKGVLEKFFSSKNGQRYKGTQSVAEDRFLKELFPHTAIPFIVWLKDGKVLNTTDAEQVSEETVNEVLKGEKSSLQTVIQLDRKRPLMLSENFEHEKNANLLGYQLLVKGRIRAIAYGSGFHRDGNIEYGRQFTNASLMDIYKGIAYRLFEKRGEKFSDKLLFNYVKSPEEIDFDTSKESKENDAKWYSLEYIVPKEVSDSLYLRMFRYLGDNTPYIASIEKRNIRCLVLKRTSSKDKIASKGGVVKDNFFGSPSVLENVTLDYMLSGLNATNDLTPLAVIDETGYKGKVDLRFSEVRDLKTFQKELLQYDLSLTQQERNISVLIVKDKH